MKRSYPDAKVPADNNGYSVEVDRENRAWFGMEGGIFYFNGVRIRRVGTEDGQPVPATYDLWTDDEGVLWAATAKGLYRRVARSPFDTPVGEEPFYFEHLPLIPSFEPVLTRVIGTFDGRLFMASQRGLFVRSPDGRVQQYTAKHGLPDSQGCYGDARSKA